MCRSEESTWGDEFAYWDAQKVYKLTGKPDAVGILRIDVDGTNNVLETVRRSDGAVVRTFGRPGRESGEFHWVHVGKFDSRGNLYTGEVDTGKRLQKWVPVE